jgi:hypothetical protein
VHLFHKPGLRCDRRQRKKVKSRILTDSPIKGHIEEEAFARAVIEKKHGKGVKNHKLKRAEECYKKSISSSSECV